MVGSSECVIVNSEEVIGSSERVIGSSKKMIGKIITCFEFHLGISKNFHL